MNRVRRRGQRNLFVALGLLCTPLLAYVYLTSIDPARNSLVMVPLPHFYVVSAASLIALVLATLVGIASVRTREPRTFMVAVGFLLVSGVFAVHGLTTPGPDMIVKELHHSIVISARLSLFFASIPFLLSTFEPPRRLTRLISRHHGPLMVGAVAIIAIYIGANLAKPDLLDFIPTGTEPRQVASPMEAHVHTAVDVGYSSVQTVPDPSPPAKLIYSPAEQFGRALGIAMAVIATSFFVLAALRFYQTYAITRTPATGALAAGLVLLAEAQVIMALGEVWHLSWWVYHGAMLFGFLIPVGAIGWAYLRGSSLAEIVDGLFVRDAFAKVERSFPEAIGALISVIEKKDPYLRGHMRRVGELTVQIAEEIALPAETARAASHAALLHDVGKLGVPPAVLHKPGRLTEEEFALLKEHPERGYRMVIQAPTLIAAAPAIRWHHERLDGSGYPDRIRGHAIPMEARIVAVADVWDALTSDRSYRNAMTPTAAREIMRTEAGEKLDERCVQALFAVLDRNQQPPVPQAKRAAPRPVERPLPTFLAS
jgi:HD-GYP domain-containing protein (c-di-GMP phosphodiesterase class II)